MFEGSRVVAQSYTKVLPPWRQWRRPAYCAALLAPRRVRRVAPVLFAVAVYIGCSEPVLCTLVLKLHSA